MGCSSRLRRGAGSKENLRSGNAPLPSYHPCEATISERLESLEKPAYTARRNFERRRTLQLSPGNGRRIVLNHLVSADARLPIRARRLIWRLIPWNGRNRRSSFIACSRVENSPTCSACHSSSITNISRASVASSSRTLALAAFSPQAQIATRSPNQIFRLRHLSKALC